MPEKMKVEVPTADEIRLIVYDVLTDVMTLVEQRPPVPPQSMAELIEGECFVFLEDYWVDTWGYASRPESLQEYIAQLAYGAILEAHLMLVLEECGDGVEQHWPAPQPAGVP